MSKHGVKIEVPEGYMLELTPEQVAIARERFNPTPAFHYETPEENSARRHEIEKKMRERAKS